MEYNKIRQLYQQKKEIALTLTVDLNQGANPQNDHDRITLKNMMGVARRRLLEEYKKEKTQKILENMDVVLEEITYNRTHKGLVLFLAEDLIEYYALPFAVGNRVKIGHHFSTRALLRAFNQTEHYYILTLSQQEVRLLECYDNVFMGENQTQFPLVNDTFYEPDRLKASFASSEDKLVQQFFRQGDEILAPIYKEKGLPMILAGPEEAISNFEKIASENLLIVGKVRGNQDSHDGSQIRELVQQASLVIHSYKESKIQASFDDLHAAKGQGLLEYDCNAIYRKAQVGQVKELVVDQDYYLKGVRDENGVIFHTKCKGGTPLDDVVNYLIHAVKATGGDVVFVPPYSIDSHHRLAAILRWK